MEINLKSFRGLTNLNSKEEKKTCGIRLWYILGPYLKQGEEGDRPWSQKISTKFKLQFFSFRGLLGPKKVT